MFNDKHGGKTIYTKDRKHYTEIPGSKQTIIVQFSPEAYNRLIWAGRWYRTKDKFYTIVDNIKQFFTR